MPLTEIPRLHQSIGKLLVLDCPAYAKKVYDEERKATKAMRRGTLIDQLVFGGREYEVVEARLKSGARKGELATNWLCKEAKEAKEEIEARGWLAVLPCELESAQATAGRVKACLLEHGIDIDSGECMKQHTLQWQGETANEGTPDLIMKFRQTGRIDTVDMKVTDCHPDRLGAQIYDQGWHIQAGAYQDAMNHLRNHLLGNLGRHWLLVVDEKRDIVTMRPMAEDYMELGRRDWFRAQRLWKQCWETGQWPEFPPEPVTMPRHVRYKAYGE